MKLSTEFVVVFWNKKKLKKKISYQTAWKGLAAQWSCSCLLEQGKAKKISHQTSWKGVAVHWSCSCLLEQEKAKKISHHTAWKDVAVHWICGCLLEQEKAKKKNIIPNSLKRFSCPMKL